MSSAEIVEICDWSIELQSKLRSARQGSTTRSRKGVFPSQLNSAEKGAVSFITAFPNATIINIIAINNATVKDFDQAFFLKDNRTHHLEPSWCISVPPSTSATPGCAETSLGREYQCLNPS
jgi:hypothetical protein